MIRPVLSSVVLSVLVGCRSLPPGAECWSLANEPLFSPLPSASAQKAMETDLEAARAALVLAPDDRDAAIWVGRHLAYLGRHREAIDAFTAALERHPGDPFLLRHRGHRYISVRQFRAAVRDLNAAARACRAVPDRQEPDGKPTPGRPPHGSLHYNVYYHLGLASFLLGDFARAETAWLRCLAVVANDESRVAVTHWLWCTRMRRGDTAGAAAVVAPITADMDIVENTSYHQLCLFYAGKMERERIVVPSGSAGAALAFGLAHRDLVCGQHESALAALRELAAAPGWTAFGVIAAEAELARD